MDFQRILNFFTNDDPKLVHARKMVGGVLASALALVLVFNVDWGEIWGVLRTVDPGLIAISYALFLPYHWFTAKSFKVVTDQHDFGLSTGRIMWVNLTLMFYVIVLPASVVGSGMRLYRYAKYSKKPVEAFAAITYHKIFTNFLVILMSLCFLIIGGVERIQESYALITGVLVAAFAMLLLIPRISIIFLRHIRQSDLQENTASFLALARNYLLKALTSFAEIGKMRLKSQLLLSIWGLLAKLIHLAAYFLVAWAVGIQSPFAQLAIVFSLVFLANNLPLNFSLGIGIREVSLGALLISIGVAPTLAVAMPVMIFSRAVFIGLIGGALEGITLLRNKNQTT